MKEVFTEITEVEHQLSIAPLTDHKVDRLIAYLDVSNLKKNNTVILTCNFTPGPHMNTVEKRPMTTGKAKVKKFHLVDTEGLKLVVPSAANVDNLLSKIARVTGSVTSKDVLVVNLSPLPRYQSSCCVVTGAKGLMPTGLSFSSFSGSEQRRRSSGGSIPDDQYKPVTIRSVNFAPIPFV